MPRQFLANLSFIVLLNVVVKPFYILGIEVSVQNAVGADTYGIFFALLNSAYLFQIVNDFGIQIYNNRLVAQDASRFQQLFSGLLQLKLILALCFIAIVLLFSLVMGYGSWINLTLPIVVNLVLVSLVLFLRSSVSGLGYYRLDSILSVMDKVLMIMICGYLLLNQPVFTIYHFVYAQMASLVLTAGVALAILATKSVVGIQWLGRQRLRALLREAGPYALAVFLMSLYTRVDGVMIEQLAQNGSYEAGLYAAGYRLLDASSMLAFLFAVLLLPMFTKSLTRHSALIQLLDQGFRLMWTLTISLSVVCFFFREEIMHLLYPEMTSTWSDVFGLLILSFNGIGMMYVFGTYITASGELRRLNILYSSFVFLNVLANYLLIPRYGAWGAAVATFGTQSLVAIALFVMARQSAKWDLTPHHILRPLAFLVGVVALAFGASHLSLELSWIWRFALTALCTFAFAFIIGMVDRNEFLALAGSRRTPN